MELMLLLVIFAFGIGFFAFCIKGLIQSIKYQKILKRKKREDAVNGIKRFDPVQLVGGLNAVKDSRCSVVVSPAVMTISCCGKEYSLQLKKITYVDRKYDIDEKMYLKSSMAKGVIGAAVFGVSGAVIGSAPRTEVRSKVTCYAIIIYENTRGEEKTIILKDDSPDMPRCSALVDTLSSRISVRTEKIEL